MIKSATIIKNNSGYLIYSNSQTTTGLWIASQPFIKLSLDSSNSLLADKILFSLNESKKNVSHPTDWKAFKKEYLENIGVKSLKSFYNAALLCEISKIENSISFLPTKNVGGKGRFDHLPELEFKVSALAGSEAICKALDEAFAKSS